MTTTVESLPEIVQRLLAEAHLCRLLDGDPVRAAHALDVLGATEDSLLGGLIAGCGGVIVDGGWLRILGSGGPEIGDGIVEWNTAAPGFEPPQGAVIVAHDVLGGFFAVNCGGLPGGIGSVHYLAPDTLQWQDLGLAHVSWLHWMVGGHLDGFYSQFRWAGWADHLHLVSPDSGISIWPPLFTAGPAIADRSRRVITQRQLWAAHAPLREQLAA